MKNTKKLALAGIFTALCVVFLLVGSLFQTLDLSAAAIGSIVTLVAFIEIGKSWAAGVYVAASVLSLLLVPYKTAAVVFAFFTGFYPIVKEYLNRIRPFWLSLTIRILCFNALLTAMIFAGKYLFGIEEDFLNLGVVIYAVSNIAFVLYDFALERISVTYITRIKPKIWGKHR